jgi:hypothetical protein
VAVVVVRRAVPRQADQPVTQASHQNSNEQINRHKPHNKQTSTAAAGVEILANNNTTPYIGRRQQRANKHTR